MKIISLGFLGLALVAYHGALANFLQEMKPGFVIPCEGDMCKITLFCWRGARYADLNQMTSRISAQVNFEDERDLCVDAESDDVLSLRALVYGYDNDTAALRLGDRIGRERSWISSMILRTLLGDHRVTGDGECHGKNCTMQFSPYGQSCIRLCSTPRNEGKEMRAEVFFRSESALDVRAFYLWLIGIALVLAAPSLSERPEMFYLTGGSLGVMFAVALLVLILSRMVTKSGPTKSQLGVAAFFQVGVVYMRKAVLDFVRSYIDWIALYVIVTFVSSLGLVHYFLKGDDGKIKLSASLKDIVRTALQLLGAFFIAVPIPSARYRLITMFVIFAFEVLSNLSEGGLWGLFAGRTHTSRLSSYIFGSEKRRVERLSERSEEEDSEVSNEEIFYNPGTTKTPSRIQATPIRPLSGSRFLTEEEYQAQGKEYTEREVRKLLTPSKPVSKQQQDMLDWIAMNHSKLFVRKEEEDDEELVDDEDDDE